MSYLDKIKISKVDNVTLWRRGTRLDGDLYITQHHLVFSYLPVSANTAASDLPPRPKELWITYPMIAFCTYRPAHPAARQQSSIRLRCRDFTFVAFNFLSEPKACETYDTIKRLTCQLKSLDQLYAFSYKPQGPEKRVDGWTIYNPMEEFRRQGVGATDANRGWRFTDVNKDYQYSPTYPATLVVPAAISDNVLNYAGKYRSRARIPVLTYLHPVNDCSISRSSQPLKGIRSHRSVQDEKLVGAIFSTSKKRPLMTSKSTPELASKKSEDQDPDSRDVQHLEDQTIAVAQQSQAVNDDQDTDDDDSPRTYGAQQRNLIVDARPTVNAIAMRAAGMGSENMDHYPFAAKAYLGIDNIHVMRDSLNKVIDALRESDVTPLPPDREKLIKSGWLKHIANIMDGACLIARQVGIHHSHVLIHCSDGWDRTGQLSALSQLCLDPYYRTMEGFIVLVEKDFVSFGHMFRHRSGLMGSDKWFEVESERIGGQTAIDQPSFNSTRGGANAFENAFLSAKSFFNKQNGGPVGRSSLSADAEDEMASYDPQKTSFSSLRTSTTDNPLEAPITKVKEVSPVFHQFLDATYQLQHQYSTRFEFNERFLRRLLYQLYACQYGTFLFDNEKSRVDANVQQRTRSVWDYFLARKEQFINPQYDGGKIDDNVRGRERLLFPTPAKTRWWAELFGREDAEMNGGTSSPFLEGAEGRESALAALETSQHTFEPNYADTVGARKDEGTAVFNQSETSSRLDVSLQSETQRTESSEETAVAEDAQDVVGTDLAKLQIEQEGGTSDLDPLSGQVATQRSSQRAVAVDTK